jgi:hypothetical protein
MPVILPKELERDWLKPINDPTDRELIEKLIKPDPAEDGITASKTTKRKGRCRQQVIASEGFDFTELN